MNRSIVARGFRYLGWRCSDISEYCKRHWVLRRSLLRRSTPMQVSDRPALIISPHQDDETLGCGGMIAAKRERQIPVSVIFVTDGSSCLKDGASDSAREAIRLLRRAEALRALAVLGVSAPDVWFLDQPDSQLGALNDQDSAGLVARIADILRQVDPAEVFLPFHHDGHPDHRVTYRLARAALLSSGVPALLRQYFVWALWDPRHLKAMTADELRNFQRFDLSGEHQGLKQAALKEYRSQVKQIAGHEVLRLPKGFMRFFGSPWEFYL